VTGDPIPVEVGQDLLDAWRVARRWVVAPDAWPVAIAIGWLPALTAELYRAWYADAALPGAASAAADGAGAPALVHRLRAAHAATTCFAGGWVVRAVGARGAARVDRGRERLHLFPPDYVHLARPGVPVRPGDVVAVTARRDQVEPDTDWWFTHARGGVPPHAPMVRVYWNCPAGAAAELVGALTRVVEESAIPYMLKCPAHAEGFARVDPFVLYLHREDWGAIRAAVREVHATIERQLRVPTPRLALRLGRGVALAEDPGNGRSFGESRARAVADGALAAIAHGVDDEPTALALIVARLHASGIAPSRPHLRAETPPELVPPW
jgi:hypothetical protein